MTKKYYFTFWFVIMMHNNITIACIRTATKTKTVKIPDRLVNFHFWKSLLKI